MNRFIDETDVKRYLAKQDVTWISCPIGKRHMKFSNLKAPPVDVSLEELAMYKEAMESGLQVQTDYYVLPIKPYAIRSICKSLEIQGSAISRMTPEDKRILLNKCVKVNTGVLHFKLCGDWVTYCGRKKSEDWSELFKEVRQHANLCHASFFSGRVNDGVMTLVYKNRSRVFRHTISDAHGLVTKEIKKEEKNNAVFKGNGNP